MATEAKFVKFKKQMAKLEASRKTPDKVKMPPNKHLSADEIADLTQWIKDGAAWPKARAAWCQGFCASFEFLTP